MQKDDWPQSWTSASSSWRTFWVASEKVPIPITRRCKKKTQESWHQMSLTTNCTLVTIFFCCWCCQHRHFPQDYITITYNFPATVFQRQFGTVLAQGSISGGWGSARKRLASRKSSSDDNKKLIFSFKANRLTTKTTNNFFWEISSGLSNQYLSKKKKQNNDSS